MTAIHILAIDLAKRSFQVCATDRGGACVDAPGKKIFLTAFRERGILSVVCQASLCGLSSHGPGCSSKNRATSVQRALCSSTGTGLPHSEH